MERIIRIIVGAGLVGYSVYSGNNWFLLGLIPLITGLINYCPMEQMMGGCKNDSNTSCCASPDNQVSQFTTENQTKKTTNCCNSNLNEKVVIKILGIGCSNCIALKKVVDEAIKNIDKECEVLKVEDETEIMKYKVMSTPGLVINDKVKSSGKLLSIDEVTNLIKEEI